MTAPPTPRIAYPEALNPAQRPLLLFHRHLRAVRAAGDNLADYDILMFRPAGLDADDSQDHGQWTPVPAAKYLKHRSLEWREAEHPHELPEHYRNLADALDAALAQSPDNPTLDNPNGGPQ